MPNENIVLTSNQNLHVAFVRVIQAHNFHPIMDVQFSQTRAVQLHLGMVKPGWSA